MSVLEVPPLQYLMVDGAGDPNTAPEYAEAVSSLFPIAYTLKFAARAQLGVDTVGSARAPCTAELSRKLFCWS